jgi:glycosyltransferase involved in cell wall biosynthesis
MVDYSIVVPVYFNEGELTLTTEALRAEVVDKTPGLRCELIFVDDGSQDGSLQELLSLRSEYPELIKVVKLTRNFGQVSAITAGLSLATGRCVVIMSADNQDPAVLVPRLLREHFEGGYEVVVCSREGRDESLFRVWTSRLFYSMMRRLSFPNMPSGGFDFVLLSRKVVDTLVRNREATPFFQGQILWTGYSTKFISYNRQKREIGKSRWTFGKKLTYLIDGVMGYSFLPIRLMSLVGLVVAMVGFSYAAVIFVIWLVYGLPVEGWAPLMIVLLVVGGMQMLMLGVIGEYLWRVLAQVRDRDPYVIEAIHDAVDSAGTAPTAASAADSTDP